MKRLRNNNQIGENLEMKPVLHNETILTIINLFIPGVHTQGMYGFYFASKTSK